MIYFDQAATSYHRPDCVATAVVEAIFHAGNASRSTAGPSIWSSRIVYEAREKIARLFNAKTENVAFTSGVTESLNLVIASFFNKGHIITTANDHNSVLRPLYLRENDLDLTIIPVDKDGNFEYELMERAFRPDTLAVITTGASNVTGNLMDIQRIGTIAHEHNALFILDAAQVAGLIPLDMENFNIDILCFTGHKELFAPQGTGGIVLREGLHPVPVKVGGSGFYSFAKNHPDMMPNVFEAGTANVHGIAGLNASVDWILKHGLDIDAILLAKTFYEGLREIEDIKIYGCFKKNRVPVISFNIKDIDSSVIADRLWMEYNIAVRSGIHCAPLIHQALGTDKQGTVRFSFSRFNTQEEVKQALIAIKEIRDDLCQD
ncbi:aminotransferase class V-fold PLP-dependent enzyme [uncultured Megamonas sp.]|uniref:aminotransferase class V-fold PLP-dependent enzyme n=1 Tax=uncultured Megamonas sp. TaxID=286140 RepID=UPI0025F1AAA7|nr:aminotransferase class V-fold PLP-dependent enzyme [uncultured Megamonas sp.]